MLARVRRGCGGRRSLGVLHSATLGGEAPSSDTTRYVTHG